MAKAWRNEAARKINARRKAGSKEGSARMQKNERLFLAKVWPIKAAGNWLMAGMLERLYERLGWIEPYPAYEKQATPKVVPVQEVPKESVVKSFLRKAKSFFTGK